MLKTARTVRILLTLALLWTAGAGAQATTGGGTTSTQGAGGTTSTNTLSQIAPNGTPENGSAGGSSSRGGGALVGGGAGTSGGGTSDGRTTSSSASPSMKSSSEADKSRVNWGTIRVFLVLAVVVGVAVWQRQRIVDWLYQEEQKPGEDASATEASARRVEVDAAEPPPPTAGFGPNVRLPLGTAIPTTRVEIRLRREPPTTGRGGASLQPDASASTHAEITLERILLEWDEAVRQGHVDSLPPMERPRR